jgi:hypothetical protein
MCFKSLSICVHILIFFGHCLNHLSPHFDHRQILHYFKQASFNHSLIILRSCVSNQKPGIMFQFMLKSCQNNFEIIFELVFKRKSQCVLTIVVISSVSIPFQLRFTDIILNS